MRVIITLPSESDHWFSRINQNLKYAKMHIRTGWTEHFTQPKNSISTSSRQFICSLGAQKSYASRTDRWLDQRMDEHVSKWVAKQITLPSLEQWTNTRNPVSSVASHMTIGHQIDRPRSFMWVCEIGSDDGWPYLKPCQSTNVRENCWPTVYARHGVRQSSFPKHFLKFADVVFSVVLLLVAFLRQLTFHVGTWEH